MTRMVDFGGVLPDGCGVPVITMSNGVDAIVDECDLDLAKWRWRCVDGYARRNFRVSRKTGEWKTILMHRAILSRMLGREMAPSEQVDHVNGDRSDNRRANLRLATQDENARNRRSAIDSTSSYLGVSWKRPRGNRRGRWVAQIQLQKRKLHIGSFQSEEEAAMAYDMAAARLFGDFANLNFPKTFRFDRPGAGFDQGNRFAAE